VVNITVVMVWHSTCNSSHGY